MTTGAPFKVRTSTSQKCVVVTSYLRLIDSFITQLKDLLGPVSRLKKKKKEEDEDDYWGAFQGEPFLREAERDRDSEKEEGREREERDQSKRTNMDDDHGWVTSERERGRER